MKRRGSPIVRFRGEYLTPEAVHAQAVREAAEARVCPQGTETALQGHRPTSMPSGADETPRSPAAAGHPADRFSGDAPEPPPSLSLYGSNSTEGARTPPRREAPQGLSTHHKKAAAALSWNVAAMIEKHGQDRVGFLTLTFADHVTDPKEAQRRFNSLRTHVLAKRYAGHVRVLERQKSGRIHYHLLVVLPDDIRTGADFEAFGRRDYKSANNHLRREWAFWRKTAGNYGFGRTELMPIMSNAHAMGAYVGKYISKHIGQREERDKGVRLVEYSKGCRTASTRFTGTGYGPTMWRRKLWTFVHMTRVSHPGEPVTGLASLRRIYGPKWSYQWRDFILNLPPSDLAIPF